MRRAESEPTAEPRAAAPRLLVLQGHSSATRLPRTIRRAFPDLEVAEHLPPPAYLAAFPVVVVDFDSLPPNVAESVLQTANLPGSATKIVLASAKIDHPYQHLFGKHRIGNVVALNGPGTDHQLAVTLRKLLQADIFGIEKYLSWATVPQVIDIHRASQREAVLRAVEQFSTSRDVHPRLRVLYRNVADELFTNAVFNAPTDAEGKARYAHYARKTEVELEAHEHVEMKLCCEGDRLGLSIADPFGSLTRERLLDYLAKGFRRGDDQIDTKAGGAGLGLYMIFQSLSEMVVNLSPGKRTEVIGFIDVSGSYREFAAKPKSMNIFTTVPPGPRSATEPTNRVASS